MTNYPKILFVTTCSFNKISGGGITFTNLFTGWPIENIATVHNDENACSNNICKKYYKLSNKEIYHFGFKNFKKENKISGDLNLSNSVSKKRTFLFKFIKYILFGNNFPNSGILSSDLINFVEEFKPDIIYTILGSSAMIDIVDQLSSKYKIPVYVHIMDDWISSNYNSGIFFFIEKYRVNKKFTNIISICKKALVISNAMKLIYEKRYKKEFLVFQNTIDIYNVKKNILLNTNKTKNSFNIVYTGSIFYYAQLNALIIFCKVIILLNQKGININFHIYTPESMSKKLKIMMNNHHFIKFHLPIEDDSIYYKTLSNADVLLLPSNFDCKSLKYIGLSMPTKVPSYLISETPILVLGNKNSAQVQYAIQNKWGHVVTKKNIKVISQCLIELLNDTHLRNQLVENAINTAKLNHDSKLIRLKFQSIFNN